MSSWYPSRRRRIDRAATVADDVLDPAEQRAVLAVAERRLVEAINEATGEAHPVPVVTAEVEAAAERASRRMTESTSPAQRERDRREDIVTIMAWVAKAQAERDGRPAPTRDELDQLRRDTLGWLDRLGR